MEVTTLDVAELDEARQIIALADSLAPVGGIFHLAMVLKDKWLANQVAINGFPISDSSCYTYTWQPGSMLH